MPELGGEREIELVGIPLGRGRARVERSADMKSVLFDYFHLCL